MKKIITFCLLVFSVVAYGQSDTVKAEWVRISKPPKHVMDVYKRQFSNVYNCSWKALQHQTDNDGISNLQYQSVFKTRYDGNFVAEYDALGRWLYSSQDKYGSNIYFRNDKRLINKMVSAIKSDSCNQGSNCVVSLKRLSYKTCQADCFVGTNQANQLQYASSGYLVEYSLNHGPTQVVEFLPDGNRLYPLPKNESSLSMSAHTEQSALAPTAKSHAKP